MDILIIMLGNFPVHGAALAVGMGPENRKFDPLKNRVIR